MFVTNVLVQIEIKKEKKKFDKKKKIKKMSESDENSSTEGEEEEEDLEVELENSFYLAKEKKEEELDSCIEELTEIIDLEQQYLKEAKIKFAKWYAFRHN